MMNICGKFRWNPSTKRSCHAKKTSTDGLRTDSPTTTTGYTMPFVCLRRKHKNGTLDFILFLKVQRTCLLFFALHGMPARTSDEKGSVRLSVCRSVRLSNAWIVTKRKTDLSRFLYDTKDHLA